MSEKICMFCMRPVRPGNGQCESCGFDGGRNNPSFYLPVGYRLNKRYVVGGLTEADGDTAAYAGYDVQLGTRVEIREFLPLNGCTRDQESGVLIPKKGAELHYKTSLMDFSDLFRNLNKLTYETGIVRTLDFFELNHTAYAILESFDGMTLREFLGLQSGVITVKQCLLLFSPIFNAVNSIHSVNLTHRGISPETILIAESGEVKLAGFATTSVRTKGTEVSPKLFSGFSAPEQYVTTMWQSAATDVFGLAATIYRCITGTTPQEADQRRVYDNLIPPNELNPAIQPHVSKALMLGMLVDQQERTQTILAFKKMLDGVNQPRERQTAPPAPGEGARKREELGVGMDEQDDQKHRILKTLMLISMLLFLASLVIYLVAGFVRSKVPAQTDEPATNGFSQTVIVVPNYIGKPLSEAEKTFQTVTFVYMIERIYVDGEPEDVVVSQSPSPNSSAKQGDTITLYINRTTIIQLPDFTGVTKENAEQWLKVNGVDDQHVRFFTEETEEGYDKTIFRQNFGPENPFNVNQDFLELTIALHPKQEPA